jgi:hypothetical protein
MKSQFEMQISFIRKCKIVNHHDFVYGISQLQLEFPKKNSEARTVVVIVLLIKIYYHSHSELSALIISFSLTD